MAATSVAACSQSKPDDVRAAPSGSGSSSIATPTQDAKSDLIEDPKDAMNVFDFEPVMRKNVPPAHFGYMVSGVDDEVTLRANREGFLKFTLRPRRLIDVSKVDMSVDILGVKYDTPIALAPIGGNRAYHPDGELAVAKAAKVGNHLSVLATGATTSIEDVIAARGAPVWFQLYPTEKFEVTKAFVTRAEKSGAPVVVVTTDRVSDRSQESANRLRKTDKRTCTDCHDRSSVTASMRSKPMYQGVDLTGLKKPTVAPSLTWDVLKRLRGVTKMKIVLKGILTEEDALLAIEHGMDGIIVSNHGGRSEDGGRSTIDTLPDIVTAVKGKIPVLVDSGFRRGTDIAKALCLGATAVLIGRPYIWGLGAFGQPGVERVLAILREELHAAMQQLGAPTAKQLVPQMVRRA